MLSAVALRYRRAIIGKIRLFFVKCDVFSTISFAAVDVYLQGSGVCRIARDSLGKAVNRNENGLFVAYSVYDTKHVSQGAAACREDSGWKKCFTAQNGENKTKQNKTKQNRWTRNSTVCFHMCFVSVFFNG
jgi:hypothetical protein